MTRPAGSTPRGLPWPSSANSHSETPAAIKSLAEAIAAQLTNLGDGVILDTFAGPLPITNNQFTVPFPRLAACTGMVCCQGFSWGGADAAGWVAHAYGSTGRWMSPQIPAAAAPAQVTIHAVGWGTPL